MIVSMGMSVSVGGELLSKIWRAEAEVTSLSYEDVFGRDEMV